MIKHHDPLLIIGMHRSGTSMITKLLHDNGMFVGKPEQLLKSNPNYLSDNPKGYWEFKPAVELTEKILDRLGGPWSDPPECIGSFEFNEVDFQSEIEEARTIFSQFQGVDRPWGWKDPRNSLLIDFWKLVFPNLKLLVCVRNPVEVAFSMSKRTSAHINFQRGLELWEFYNNIIQNKLRNYPSLVTHYESYFYSSKKEVSRVLGFLGLQQTPMTEDSVDTHSIEETLYRGMIPINEHTGKLIPNQVKQLYYELCQQAGDVYQQLENDFQYNDRKKQTSFIKLFSSSTKTFDELNSKIQEFQMETQRLSGDIEKLSSHLSETQIKFRTEIETMNSAQERMFIEHQKVKETNFQLEIELSQIKNSRQWKFLNKYKPIYGKVYWFFARLMKLKPLQVGKSNDPVSVWIQNSFVSPEEIEQQKIDAKTFEEQPTFSFITPVYNPSPAIFKELIISILNQTYPRWELCLANGGADQEIAHIIKEFSDQDPRIKYKNLDQNLGISGNSNQALSLAEGEFIVICDHDDLIEPNLLYEAVQLIHQESRVDMIYYDEDKVDEFGNHYAPFLKPSKFSPDLLISMNYLTHSIIRRSLIDEVGGFDTQTDGAQDWDIFLKIVERTNQIFHIGKILYHWRSVETSASSGAHIKPYALKAQTRAIKKHIQRLGMDDAGYHISYHIRRARWKYPVEKISIIIPVVDVNMSTIDLEQMIRMINYPDLEILLIGNTFSKLHHYASISEKILVHNMPLQSPMEAINYGANISQSNYIFTCHPKMTPANPDTLSELSMWLQKPGVGIASSKLMNKHTQRIHSFGRIFGLGGLAGDLFRGMEEDSNTFFGSTMNYHNGQLISPYGLLIDRNLFLSNGGLSEDLHEDFSAIKLCFNVLEAGKRILMNPFSKFFITPTSKRISFEDIVRAYSICQSNLNFYENFYNPNLSYHHVFPTLAGIQRDAVDLSLDSILRRHYQSSSNIMS